MPHTDFDGAFRGLRAILEPYVPKLVVVHDTPDHLYLDTAHLAANRRPIFFASARIARQYVSFHLMPVYVWPELLDGLSVGLKKHMQGKSCFNFKVPEPELFAELEALTRRGWERYREEGYVQE